MKRDTLASLMEAWAKTYWLEKKGLNHCLVSCCKGVPQKEWRQEQKRGYSPDAESELNPIPKKMKNDQTQGDTASNMSEGDMSSDSDGTHTLVVEIANLEHEQMGCVPPENAMNLEEDGSGS
ncbi:hypothetical protein NDU88_004949 [Pleurodeles waltl]|uniref:Uncharacterized protein n=1 Tax=Pleurodeles waltl TaxID=8319 RepID=A0AAV7RHM5_PLEWA|nr:hypothetical protein NDU88_004949 [Pleurodeles waltl]